jgi:hypothetical protein
MTKKMMNVTIVTATNITTIHARRLRMNEVTGLPDLP